MARVGCCSWYPLMMQSSYRLGVDTRKVGKFWPFPKRSELGIVVEVNPNVYGNTNQAEYCNGSLIEFLSSGKEIH